jgi:hypothetical protein
MFTVALVATRHGANDYYTMTCSLEPGYYELFVSDVDPPTDPIYGRLGALFTEEAVVAPGGKGITIVPGPLHYELHLDPDRRSTRFRIAVDHLGDYLVAIAEPPDLAIADHVNLLDQSARSVRCR